MTGKNHVVIGSSGGIGQQFVKQLAKNTSDTIYAFSRSQKNFHQVNVIEHSIDLNSETSIKNATNVFSADIKIDSIIVASGLLYDEQTKPEKCLEDITLSSLEKIYTVNTFAPILIAKYFLPFIKRDTRTTFAAISARVSSISDNRLGGWYAYRSSKAALNMLLKTLSIEASRRYKKLIVAGLHPGTVNTHLSEPFQNNVPNGKLFTPEYSVNSMLNVIENLKLDDSGNLFDYAGKIILP
jgi:NAD(P)-dependent dehydrogenase (short-subunit alcohol dehydrogenase family)